MNWLLLINTPYGVAAHSIYNTYDEAFERGVALGVAFEVVEA